MQDGYIIEDDAEPWEITDSGDLARVHGAELIKQRILRLLFTKKGDIIHRPDDGVDLQSKRNATASPVVIQRIYNDITSFLNQLDGIESHHIKIYHKDASFFFTIKATINHDEIVIEDVPIE